MPRLARIVIPDYPHHIIHHGNRMADSLFVKDEDTGRPLGDNGKIITQEKAWAEQEQG